MNLIKQKAFNEKMGKAKHYPRHQNLAKGGMVDKRKYFDAGGVANGTTNSGNVTAGLTAGNPLANAGPILAAQPVTDTVGGIIQGVGTLSNDIGGAFTPQNQYQAQLAPTANLNYAPAINAGAENALNPAAVNNAIASEQGLAGQYGQIAAGQGPNPALTALANQTGTNVANTAALQAGQRGGAQNVGLLSRQIGQQGAATQQNAVGQAANLQANQSLGALGAQAGLQNQIATQGLGEQGIGANVYAAGAGANNAQNSNNISNYAQAQGLNQSTAAGNAAATNQTTGGLLGGAGALLSALNKGGEVQKFDDGGSVLGIAPLPGATVQPSAGPTLGVDTTLNPNNATVATGTLVPDSANKSAQSILGKALEGKQSGNSDPTGFKGLGAGLGSLFADGGKVCTGPHQSHLMNSMFSEGGNTGKEVKALVSAKEVYLDPHQVDEVVHRGADPMKIGHQFPGKDKVSKNSQKNDVIPVTLEDGGVVLPISVTTHKDASEKGRRFVEKAHAKRYLKRPKGM